MAKRKCINASEALKRENFILASLNGDKDLFKELKKRRGFDSTTSTKVDGANSPESIADKFKDIYEKLYNRTSNSEPINKLLSEINENVSEKDMDDVEKVTSEMVENILKTKIKNGKSDPDFDITTDCLKQGPKEVSKHLAIFIKSALIHGHICQDLLNCAIIPLLKDKNGKRDDSNNYRGIGLSCLVPMCCSSSL